VRGKYSSFENMSTGGMADSIPFELDVEPALHFFSNSPRGGAPQDEQLIPVDEGACSLVESIGEPSACLESSLIRANDSLRLHPRLWNCVAQPDRFPAFGNDVNLTSSSPFAVASSIVSISQLQTDAPKPNGSVLSVGTVDISNAHAVV